jgi:hypothetical protein
MTLHSGRKQKYELKLTGEKCLAVLDAFDRDFENDSRALRQMFAFPD